MGFQLIRSVALSSSATPTFKRNNWAYLSNYSLVNANIPRFWPGKWGKAFLCEEGTDNLFAASGRAVNFNTAYTVTLNGTYTVSINGGTGSLVLSNGATGTVGVGQSLTFTVSNTSVTFTPTGGTPQYCQLEQKPYATTWHGNNINISGPRYPETLTVPSFDVINPEQGTIELWINLYRPPVPNAQAQYIVDFAGPANNNLVLYVGTDGKLRCDYSGAQPISLVGTTPLQAKTWYHVAVRWSSSGVVIFLNGSMEASSTVPPSLTPGKEIYIGSKADGTSQLSGLMSSMRFSYVPRENAEILAGYQTDAPLPVDNYTVYYLSFNDTLEPGKTSIWQLSN